ncbi:MAG: MATE family efflux transporter [Armatimonadota bacterium]
MSTVTAKTERNQGRDMTVGSIPRHMAAFAMPMLAGNLLQMAYSFVNAFWVGRGLGTAELAAVTVSFPVIFALLPIGVGLTMATNILVSQHYGARDMGQVRRVTDSSTVLVVVVSLLITLIGELLAPMIIRAMDTAPDVYPLAVGYLRIMLLSLPFGFGLFLTRSTLQGIGDSTTPLYFVTASVIVTAILDPLLMFGKLGFPNLGLNGTAWATLWTQMAALAALVLHMQIRKSVVTPSWRNLQVDWATIWHITRIGVPSAVQQSLVSVSMLFVVGFVNAFGKTATAAFGVASRFDQLAFIPAMTFSMAISTLAGQNIGAGKLHRVREIFGWGLAYCGGFTIIASLLAVLAPRFVLQLFTDDKTVLDLGVPYLRIVGSSYVFFALTFSSNGVINGSGHTLITTLIALVGLWLVRVPLAWLLPRFFDGVTGIWYAMAISFAVSSVVSIGFYLSGYWKRPIISRRPPVQETEVPAKEAPEV